MKAINKIRELQSRLNARGISLPLEVVATLRRASMALHRWHEGECGDSNDYASFAIERDDETGIPYRVIYRHDSDRVIRQRIPDREKGAVARVSRIARDYGFTFYVQTDPRGCALYVSHGPLDSANYSTEGVAIY